MSNMVVYVSAFVAAVIFYVILFLINYCMRLFAADDARADPERPAAADGNVAGSVVVDVVGLQRNLIKEKRRLKLEERIPSVVIIKEDDSSTGKESSDCAICVQEFEAGEEVRVLPGCGHSYHSACIDKWLLDYDSKQCPTCRAITL